MQNNQKTNKKDKVTQEPELFEDITKPELLDNFFKPNLQFIPSAKQLKPRAKEIIMAFEKFRDTLNIKEIQSISIRTGSGFMINTAAFDNQNFMQDNVLEIIDFDPVRNNLMVIGNEPPASDATIHWFIYRGLPWINGVINVNNSEIVECFQNSQYSRVNLVGKMFNTNLALEILRLAKTSEIIILEGQSVLVVGKTLSDVFNSLDYNLKKLLKSKKSKKPKNKQ